MEYSVEVWQTSPGLHFAVDIDTLARVEDITVMVAKMFDANAELGAGFPYVVHIEVAWSL